MFFIDYEKFYGIKSSEISGSRPAPTRNSAEGYISVDGSEAGEIDSASDKLSAVKNKFTAGAVAMLSGIGSKASGFMSSKKRPVPESSQYAEMDSDEVRYSETFGTSTGFGQNNVNKVLIAVIAVLVVGISFMGGMMVMMSRNNKEKPVNNGVNIEGNTTVPAYNDIVTTVQSTADVQVTEPINTDSSSWSEAYAKLLNEFMNSDRMSRMEDCNSMYDLFDIDSDGTPELAISVFPAERSACEFYKFNGSECEFINKDYTTDIGQLGWCYIDTERKYSVSQHSLWATTWIYAFKIGSWELVDSYVDNFNYAQSESELKWSHNGKDIPIEDYVKYYNEYAKRQYYRVGREYEFNGNITPELLKEKYEHDDRDSCSLWEVSVPDALKTANDKHTPTINAYLERKQGYQGISIYLFADGDFSSADVSIYYNGKKDSSNVYSKAELASSVFITSYSGLGPGDYHVEIVPKSEDGTVGKLTILNIREPINYNRSVIYVLRDRYGVINCHGETVPGITTDCAANNGSYATVRKSLGDGWHIVAKNACRKYDGVFYYEQWDAWDGDYYGWVDENHIDFDNNDYEVLDFY